jgi:hypothetical protein
MSLLDEVRKFEHQVVERLRELEPLIAEYNQLRKLAGRLGVSYTPPQEDTAASTAPAGRTSAAKQSKPARRSAAKPRSARRKPARSAAKRASPTSAAGAGATQPAGTATAAAKAVPAKATSAKQSARRRRGRKAAAARPGQRIQDVLRVVGEQPGSSVREIGEQLGVDATGLYRVANKLTADGRLRKDGTRLYVVESGAAAQPQTVAESASPDGANAGAQPNSPSAAGASGDAVPGAKASSST